MVIIGETPNGPDFSGNLKYSNKMFVHLIG